MIENKLQLIPPALLGVLFHLFVVKLPSARRKSKAANIPFSPAAYIKEEWDIIVGNLICVSMLIIGIDELAKWKPSIINAVKWLFFFVGISGSSVFMYAFSRVDKTFKKIIDIKTNVADGLISKGEGERLLAKQESKLKP